MPIPQPIRRSSETDVLKLAIQKSGRLSEGTLKLLQECDIRPQGGTATLKAPVNGFPMELLFLRDDDIPEYVEDGVADLGVLGANVVDEFARNVNTLKPLGFARCRLSLAVPRQAHYSGLDYLHGKRIATTYPTLLRHFLDEHHIQADIHTIRGSVEIAPSIGLSEVICDIVSTGSTLFHNGLKEVETIYRSEAVLIANRHLPPEKAELVNQLMVRIRAVNAANDHKYVLLNVPNHKIEAISHMLSGMKSPTVMPLAEEGWSSMHVVLKSDDFWMRIGQVKEMGAQGILVIPIEKMIV